MKARYGAATGFGPYDRRVVYGFAVPATPAINLVDPIELSWNPAELTPGRAPFPFLSLPRFGKPCAIRYPETSVVRAISSSFLSLLLLVTLMWGGCISCPQFFMVPKAEKSCCDEAGKCKRQQKSPIEKECQRMPLEPPSLGGANHTIALATLPTPVLETLPSPVVLADSMHRELLPLEHSPPDLQVLNATFLI